LLRLGRAEESLVHHKIYQRIKNNEGMINVVALHLAYLAHLNNVPSALKLFEKHLLWV
jgi:hypothetical protein